MAGKPCMVFIGINAAISVRVSNELGLRHPRATKYSVYVTVFQALVAYINLGSYYIFGLPLRFVLGYSANPGVMVEQTTERMRKWGGQDIETEKLAIDQLSFRNREP